MSIFPTEVDLNGDKMFIQVRNPWGSETEWKGTWADGGKMWGRISDKVIFLILGLGKNI